MNIAAIYRARRFSPNSEEKDRLIMDAVVNGLRNDGHCVECMAEDDCRIALHTDLCVSMSRSDYAREIIKEASIPSINSADSGMRCGKQNVRNVMRCNNIPMAPDKGTCGYWVKRGDGQPQGRNDIVFANDEKETEQAVRAFANRGITNVTVEAHVRGDLIKFYAVEGTDFFRMYYPTDDGQFKFDNEQHNGKAAHYIFDKKALKNAAMQLAQLLNTPVCGGDCVVRSDGSFAIIDFNDWPSFSRCRDDAAAAIIELIKKNFK